MFLNFASKHFKWMLVFAVLTVVTNSAFAALPMACESVFGRSLRLAPQSESGLDLKSALNGSLKIKTVDMPVRGSNFSTEMLLLDGVYDPSVYSGSFNLVKAISPLLHLNSRVLIVGTGSGYEALGISTLNPAVRIDAIDINDRAVLNTELNADFYHQKNITAFQSDLFENVNSKYDLIIFHAPRAVDANLKNDRVHDANFFDPGEQIRTKFLAQAKDYLTATGSVVLLTESHFVPPPHYTSEILATAPWIEKKTIEGNYAIFKLDENDPQAQSKIPNIEIQHFRFFDADQVAKINRLTLKVEALLEKFHVPPLKIFFEFNDVNPAYDMRTQRIVIALRDINQPDVNLLTALAHEAGHHIYREWTQENSPTVAKMYRLKGYLWRLQSGRLSRSATTRFAATQLSRFVNFNLISMGTHPQRVALTQTDGSLSELFSDVFALAVTKKTEFRFSQNPERAGARSFENYHLNVLGRESSRHDFYDLTRVFLEQRFKITKMTDDEVIKLLYVLLQASRDQIEDGFKRGGRFYRDVNVANADLMDRILKLTNEKK